MEDNKFIRVKFPLMFPNKISRNGIVFSKESLEGVQFKNYPIVCDDRAVGIVTRHSQAIESEGDVVFDVEALMFANFKYSIRNVQFDEEDGVKVIRSFEFDSVSIWKEYSFIWRIKWAKKITVHP